MLGTIIEQIQRTIQKLYILYFIHGQNQYKVTNLSRYRGQIRV